MKIFNFIGTWIDKLENKIFGGEGYQPLAGKGFVQTLTVGIGMGILLFIVQMTTTGKTVENWVVGIGGVAMLATMVKAVLPVFMKGTGTIVAKIGYGFFCFFLVLIAVQLAVWIVMLVLFLLILCIIFYFIGGSSGSSSKKGWVTIKHADGSTEERKTKSGVTGEKWVTDKNGNTWDVPYGKNYLEVNP